MAATYFAENDHTVSLLFPTVPNGTLRFLSIGPAGLGMAHRRSPHGDGRVGHVGVGLGTYL